MTSAPTSRKDRRNNKKRGSLRATRTFAIVEASNIANNTDKAIKIAERFYVHLYASNVRPGKCTERTSLVCEVPTGTKDEVGIALKVMKKGKAAGGEGITVDHLKVGRNIVLDELAKLSQEASRCH